MNKIWTRALVQVFFFLLVAGIVTNRQLVETGNAIPFLAEASIHAICPFGGVESMYQYLVVGSYTREIFQSSFVLMYLVFAMTLLFGAVFCGWVCPLGTVQEWVGKLGRKIFGFKYNKMIPKKVDAAMRYLRYLVLGWVLYGTAKMGHLIFKSIDPYYALFQFWTGEVAVTAFIVLALTLGGSLLVERPWCKYLCPYGAVLGAVAKIRVFALNRNPDTCVSCNLCSNNCPMNIDVADAKSIRHSQCIGCMECTSEAICPAPNTVIMGMRGISREN
ncbi:polyferredoxin [Desulfitispora alkaliphila]|uniref:4Fe-4S binding protein n=1 Tax=Desulfitispora alkaliphila TaxID=622674 RepID=UPI003D1BAD26